MNCPLCHGAGWIFDCNPEREPVALEVIACPLPDCPVRGREVAYVAFKGLALTEVARHPTEDYVMSLSPTA